MNTNSKTRVLIADNDSRYISLLSQFLDANVYEVLGVESGEKAALEAIVFHPHVAIIDLRLADDDDTRDQSGLDLIRHNNLKSARCILYSAYLDLDIVKLVRDYPNVADYIEKTKTTALLPAVQKAAAQVSASFRGLIIESMPKSLDKIIGELFDVNSKIPTDLVTDVLAQLFPDSKSIRLMPMENALVTPTSFTHKHSVVYRVWDGEHLQPYVVKLAPAQQIDIEAGCYKQYIDGQLKGAFHSVIDGKPVLFYELGGLRYKFLGEGSSGQLTFTSLYHQLNLPGEVVKPLRFFFSTVWKDLYQRKSLLNKNVFESYNEYLKLSDKIKAYPDKAKLMNLSGFPVKCYNPIDWVMRHSKDSFMAFSIYQAVTHGDLHGDNLLVDEEGHAWAMDFERSGSAHILRDFIELETDILSRLIPIKDEQQLVPFAKLLLSLMSPKNFDAKIPGGVVYTIEESYEKELQKAQEVIVELRKMAHELTEFRDYREYYLGMLFNATFVACVSAHNTSDDFTKSRALLLGTLLCQRLHDWDIGWPPDDWVSALNYQVKSTTSTRDKTTPEPKPSMLYILHLSDLHLENAVEAETYLGHLESDLHKNFDRQQLDFVVLSGDVANQSKPEEYEAAKLLINGLKSRFGVDRQNLVIVPGNHDLNYDESEKAYRFIPKRGLAGKLPSEPSYESGDGYRVADDMPAYQRRFHYFSKFYEDVCGKPYALEVEHQGIVIRDSAHHILFLGLNSSWKSDHHFAKESSGINPLTLVRAIDQIKDCNSSWLKIAVFHHPITGAEAMKDVGFTQQLAVAGFEICMHGHIHQAIENYHQYDNNRGLRIIGAGTFGAPSKELVPGIPLQYNLLELNPINGKLTVKTRKKEIPSGAWSADARWGDKEHPSPEYTIQLKWRQNS
jgi:CheY-like chemotaxis protein